MAFTSRADLNIGLVNQYILNSRGSIQGFGQTIIDFFDPTPGLPVSPSSGDKYISTATANGWILNNIVVYDEKLGVWKNVVPIAGALVWREVPGDMRIYNAATVAWEVPAGALGAIIAPSPVQDNAIVRFDGITGNAVATSGITIDDFNNVIGMNNLSLDGDLNVNGTTTTINSEQLNVADAFICTGKGYTLAVDRPAGIVFNYLGTGITTTTVSPGFTAEVVATSDATITVAAAGPLYNNGDFIQVSDSGFNDGIYEVLSHGSNIITVKSTGITPPTEDFVSNKMTTEDFTGATIAGVTLMVLRTTGGVMEYGSASASGIVYTPLASTASTVGKEIFNADGVFVVPAGVTQVWVTMIGGSGSAGSAFGVNSAGAGSGSGMAIVRYPRTVAPGDTLTVTIGQGGINPGDFGGDTTVDFNGTFTLSAFGSGPGGNALSSQVGSGSSGGGPISKGNAGLSNHTSLVAAGLGAIGANSSTKFPIIADQSADGGDAGTFAFSTDGFEGSTSLFAVTGSSGAGATFATTNAGRRGGNSVSFEGGAASPVTVVAEAKPGSGAASIFGSGADAPTGSSNGLSALPNTGAGASGACDNDNTGPYLGGAGSSGKCIIEYA